MIAYEFMRHGDFGRLSEADLAAMAELADQIQRHEQVCDLRFGFRIDDPDFTPEQIRRNVVDVADYIELARDGDIVIGMIYSCKGEYGYIPGSTYIESCAVLEQYRNKGVGTAMMRGFIEGCRSSGVRTVVLHVNAANGRAEHVYAKAGYQKIGTVMAKNLL